MFESKKNNVWFNIGNSLTANTSSTLLTIQGGKETLFGADFGISDTTKHFKLTLTKFVGGVASISEIVKVMAKSGNALTIVRAYEPCPLNANATVMTQAPQVFDIGDFAYMNMTASDLIELGALVDTKQNNCTLNTISTNTTFVGTEKNGGAYSINTTSGNITITINPALFNLSNGLYEFSFCKATNDVNTITIDATTGKTIDSNQTLVLTNYNEVATLVIATSSFIKIKSQKGNDIIPKTFFNLPITGINRRWKLGRITGGDQRRFKIELVGGVGYGGYYYSNRGGIVTIIGGIAVGADPALTLDGNWYDNNQSIGITEIQIKKISSTEFDLYIYIENGSTPYGELLMYLESSGAVTFAKNVVEENPTGGSVIPKQLNENYVLKTDVIKTAASSGSISCNTSSFNIIITHNLNKIPKKITFYSGLYNASMDSSTEATNFCFGQLIDGSYSGYSINTNKSSTYIGNIQINSNTSSIFSLNIVNSGVTYNFVGTISNITNNDFTLNYVKTGVGSPNCNITYNYLIE